MFNQVFTRGFYLAMQVTSRNLGLRDSIHCLVPRSYSVVTSELSSRLPGLDTKQIVKQLGAAWTVGVEISADISSMY